MSIFGDPKWRKIGCSAVCFATIALVGCNNRQATIAENITVSGSTTISPPTLLIGRGPVNELSLRFDSTYQVAFGPNREPYIQSPEGRRVYVRASVVDADNHRIALQESGTTVGEIPTLVFEARVPMDETRQYRSIELSTDAPTQIKAVRWWSGTRRAFL